MGMGERISELRKGKNLTMAAAARLAGTSSGYWSDLESGRRQPGLDLLRSMAEALGTTPGYLADGVDDAVAGTVPLAGEVSARGDVVSDVLAADSRLPRASKRGIDLSRRIPIPDELDAGPRALAIEATATLADGPVLAGDVLVLDPDATPEDGDLVAVVYTEEDGDDLHEGGCLRRFALFRGHPVLLPLVEGDAPRMVGADWQVAAVVIGQWRARPGIKVVE